jgi:hypothetical protein
MKNIDKIVESIFETGEIHKAILPKHKIVLPKDDITKKDIINYIIEEEVVIETKNEIKETKNEIKEIVKSSLKEISPKISKSYDKKGGIFDYIKNYLITKGIISEKDVKGSLVAKEWLKEYVNENFDMTGGISKSYKDFHKFRNEGKSYFNRGLYEKSIKSYERALEIYGELGLPDDLESNINQINNFLKLSKSKGITPLSNAVIGYGDLLKYKEKEEKDKEGVIDLGGKEEDDQVGTKNDYDGKIKEDFINILKEKIENSEIKKYGKWKLTGINKDNKIISKRYIDEKSNIYEVFIGDLGIDELDLDYEDFKKVNDEGNIVPAGIIKKVEKSIPIERHFNKKKTWVQGHLEHSMDVDTKILLHQSLSVIDDIINYVIDNKLKTNKTTLLDWYSRLGNIIVTYMPSDTEKVSNEEKQVTLTRITEDLEKLLELIQKSPSKFNTYIDDIHNYSRDIDRISDVFKEVRRTLYLEYEKSFCNCGEFFTCEEENEEGKMVSTLGDSSRVSKLSISKFVKEYHSGKKTLKEVVGELYTSINNSMIKKYDIIAKKDIILGGEKIKKGSKIEVKKTTKREYHLSEFLTIYKNRDGIKKYLHDENYIHSYNEIIYELVGELNKDDKGIISKIKDQTAGIFLENYLYYPMGKVDLKWSIYGQRNKIKRLDSKTKESLGVFPEYRLTLRFEVEGEGYRWVEGNCNLGLNGIDESIENTDYISEYVNNILDF